MDISIIIINYHSTPLLIESIRSIGERTRGVDCEIIVVDNGSSDGVSEQLQAAFGDSVRLIAAPENLGFGKGNNLGAKYASGRYLFFLNPDTYLLNNAIKILADYLDEHPEAGVAGGNLYQPDESPAPSFCREFDTPKAERHGALWRTILGEKLKEKHGKQSTRMVTENFNDSGEPLPVAYVFGADMMVRRKLFEEMEGFDSDFFMYAEEEELSFRIKNAGHEILSVPGAKIVHLEGASTRMDEGFNERQFRMRIHGKLLYYKKCFGEEGQKTFYKAPVRGQCR